MKYLTEIEIRTLISLGKTLELFLGHPTDNKEILNWVSLTKGRNGQIDVSTYSVYDEGDIENLDIYSFTSVNPDELYETKQFATLNEALTFIRDNYQLTDLRVVNEGVIQNEYKLLKEEDNT